jgi:hypothetical protein
MTWFDGRQKTLFLRRRRTSNLSVFAKKVGRGGREANALFSLVFEGCFEKSGVQNVVFCMVKRGELHGECGVLAATF